MTWVRIDDAITDNRKVLSSNFPPLMVALHVAALAYCNRNLTDGFLPEAKAPVLLPLGKGLAFVDGMYGEDASWERVIADLCRIRAWRKVRGGYRINDYLEYQPSRDEIIAKSVLLSETRKKAGKSGGNRRWENRRSTMANIANDIANAYQTDSPIPIPKEKDLRDKVFTERTELVEILARYSGWNADKSAKKQEIALRSDFPRLNLLDCAKAWAAWAEDAKNPPMNCWSSFRNWCKSEYAKLPPPPERVVW